MVTLCFLDRWWPLGLREGERALVARPHCWNYSSISDLHVSRPQRRVSLNCLSVKMLSNINTEASNQFTNVLLTLFQISCERGCRQRVARKLSWIQAESGEMCPEVARRASLNTPTHTYTHWLPVVTTPPNNTTFNGNSAKAKQQALLCPYFKIIVALRTWFSYIFF